MQMLRWQETCLEEFIRVMLAEGLPLILSLWLSSVALARLAKP